MPLCLPLIFRFSDDDVVVVPDNDDVVVVCDPGEMEVCLGRIEGARVNAHQLPCQKVGGFKGTSASWPPLKLSVHRKPESRNNVINVRDPRGTIFGTLDAKTAFGLAPLVDNKQAKVRLQVRLEPRERKQGDFEGKVVSETFPISLNIYAVRKYAKSIGTHLSKKQIWLRDPLFCDNGIEYFNPQRPEGLPATNRRTGFPSTAGGTSGMTYANRTVEEIRSDVMSVFDSLTKSEDLPSAEQDSSIKTPLLQHQKQALYFMVNREKVHDAVENGGTLEGNDAKNALWKLRYRENGKKVYYNIITGM